MKLAIVGATGLVGREILAVLEERGFYPKQLIPVATPKSFGQIIHFNGRDYLVTGHEEALALKPDIAIFSAGGGTSLEWAPKYAAAGTIVIDNSSAWRMDDNVPLVVPEINGPVIRKSHKIISNPNCSTIQMVLVLAPLHRKFKIKRIVVSTYQSVTGTGAKALRQLENERKGIEGEKAYPHPIDLNLIPHGGFFLENGYTSEEIKLVTETQKILDDHSIRVTGTVVRVPVTGGHSESVNIEFENEYELPDIFSILSSAEGIIITDDPSKNSYPMPLNARGKDAVFVGRIRRDESIPRALNLFIVADNLRKGAATNAVQIAEYLVQGNFAGV